MDIKNPPVKRRGHKQKNMLTEYYCPTCDHLEYDGSDSNPWILTISNSSSFQFHIHFDSETTESIFTKYVVSSTWQVILREPRKVTQTIIYLALDLFKKNSYKIPFRLTNIYVNLVILRISAKSLPLTISPCTLCSQSNLNLFIIDNSVNLIYLTWKWPAEIMPELTSNR